MNLFTQTPVQQNISRALVLDIDDFGVAGDGTTDDSSPLQAAIDYAESLAGSSNPTLVNAGYVFVNLKGRQYALDAGLTIEKKIILGNGALKALSGFADTYMLTITAAQAERTILAQLDLDGGLSGTTRFADVLLIDAPRIHCYDLFIIHFPNYGVRITNGAQETHIAHSLIREWAFSEIGTTDTTYRTAKGLSVEDADNLFSNVVIAQCGTPLYVSGSLNLFTACHIYNGGMTDSSIDAVNVVLDDTDNNVFTGCYFDNGIVQIVDSFNHKITGCMFQKTGNGNNNSAIETVTSLTNTGIDGLNVCGNTFNGTYTDGYLKRSTTGSGTYKDENFQGFSWAGNVNTNGGMVEYAFKYGSAGSLDTTGDTFTLVSAADQATLRTAKGLILSADYDANSGTGQSAIDFYTDGSRKVRVNYNGRIDVSTVTDYENLVTADDDIPNAKWVLDNMQDLGEYTVAGLPAAASNTNAYAVATDASGGRTLVRSDGTNWKVITVEGATVST